MTRASRLVTFAVAALVWLPSPARAAAKEIVIPWSSKIDAVAIKDAINRLRINGEDSVSIRIVHFNFLHYSLKVTVEERTIESYAMLDRLWSQVFKLAGPAFEVAPAGFDGAVVAWRRSLATADAALGDYTKGFAGRTALTFDECGAIGQHGRTLGTEAIDRVEGLRRDALDKADSSDDFDVYERVLAQHRAVVERLSGFVTAANLVEHGWVEPLGKKKAATVVTFTISPLGRSGAAAGEPFQGSYFVRSTRPLLLHVGYSASTLNDLRFDRVRAANGSDLFLATKSSDSTQSLVTFLSYEVGRWGPTGEIGAHVALGTSFQKPGENMFFGGGVRITRFLLTAGTLGSGITEGKASVLEPIAGVAGARELFSTVSTRKQWAPFFSVSVRVY